MEDQVAYSILHESSLTRYNSNLLIVCSLFKGQRNTVDPHLWARRRLLALKYWAIHFLQTTEKLRRDSRVAWEKLECYLPKRKNTIIFLLTRQEFLARYQDRRTARVAFSYNRIGPMALHLYPISKKVFPNWELLSSSTCKTVTRVLVRNNCWKVFWSYLDYVYRPHSLGMMEIGYGKVIICAQKSAWMKTSPSWPKRWRILCIG